jgi:hypothetical protein
MKYPYFFILLVILPFELSAQIRPFGKKDKPTPENAPVKVVEGHLSPIVKFKENKNQWSPDIRYRAEIPNGYIFLKDNALVYSFYDNSEAVIPHPAPADYVRPKSPVVKGHNVEVKFLNINTNKTAKFAPQKQSTEVYNYFLGNDEKKWASNVHAYETVYYREIYSNIDLKISGKNKSAKYEFIAQAHADISKIALQYTGTASLKLVNNELEIETTLGKITEKAPYCYQIINKQEVQVQAVFELKGDILQFKFPQGYDANYPLIIDPDLVFSTYSGSTADNWGSTATYDEAGNLYSAGIVFTGNGTSGTGFPTTPGAFQLSFAGGDTDIGILKFNPTGTSLIYATYIGGNDSEFPHSLVVNKNNELIVYGSTSSTNYPTTQTAFDRNLNNNSNGESVTPIGGIDYTNGSDIILTKLNVNGTALIGSTYLGGTGWDGINVSNTFTLKNYGDAFRGEVIVDSLGFIYVASTTNSSNFPTTPNAPQTTLQGGQDGVIVKLKADLTGLVWSTYFGGSSVDAAYSVKLDTLYNIFVCGATRSTNLPNTTGGFKPTSSGGDDGFLAKLTNGGTFLQTTYIGTTQADQVFVLDFDPEGNVYVVGQTFGAYPISPGVYNNGNSGQFIHKISNDLTTSLLSTTIGKADGNPDISPTAFLVNDCGNVYLTGWGSAVGGTTNLSTTGLTTTADAFDSSTDGNDFYIIILEKDFKSRLYATFFGGSSSADHVDGGTSRFDKKGVIYHAVCASCGGFDDFPTTQGVWSRTNNSNNCNNGSFKFDIGTLEADFATIDTENNQPTLQVCRFPADILIDDQSTGVSAWRWEIDNVFVSNAQSFIYPFPAAGDYQIKLIASNPASCLKADTVTKILRISQVELSVSPGDTICFGESYQLESVLDGSTPPFAYAWTPATGLSDPTIPNPVATPQATTTYTLLVKDKNGCEAQKEVTVNVIPLLDDDFDILGVSDVDINTACVPANLNLTYDFAAFQVDSWVWTVQGFGTFPNQATVNLVLNQPGTIQIQLDVTRGGECPQVESVVRTITVQEVKVTAEDKTICSGGGVEIFANATSLPVGTLTYKWTPTTGLNNPSIANPTASPTRTTTYKVVVKDSKGCKAETEVKVNVIDTPIVDFELSTDSDCGKATQMTFENKTVHGVTFEWLIDGTLVSTDENPPLFIFESNNQSPAGTHTVTLKAYNAGCVEELSKEIEIEDNQNLPPNAITPDGDSQRKNETFKLSPERVGYKIEIYNRWGNLLFKADNYQDDWGRGIKAGVYYYILTSPQGVVCKGWINVMR